MVGNVVEDRLPDGRWSPGGPSLYAARTAAALGASVTLVTRLTAGYPQVFAGLQVVPLPAASTPRYANTYDVRGDRTQYLVDPGEPLDPLPEVAGPVDALIVAPAYHEMARAPLAAWKRYAAPVQSISLQGLLRSTSPDGRIVPADAPIPRALAATPPGATAFFSEEDTGDPESLAFALAEAGAVAIVTRGYRGATLYLPHREPARLAALPARPVDPTGAGDCFSAAYTVCLAETGDITNACRYALAAGALAVEAEGLLGVPTRAQIDERLAREAA